VKHDIPPTHNFVRAIFAIVITAALVVATYYLMTYFFVRSRP
jgi:heme/copper-type cytochrome/quinol oxidase subunit 4